MTQERRAMHQSEARIGLCLPRFKSGTDRSASYHGLLLQGTNLGTNYDHIKQLETCARDIPPENYGLKGLVS